LVFQGEGEVILSATFQKNNQEAEYYLKCVGKNIEERYLKVDGEKIIQEERGKGKYISREGKEKEFDVGWEGLIGKISDDYALRHGQMEILQLYGSKN